MSNNNFYYQITLCKGNFKPAYNINPNKIEFTKRYRDYNSLTFTISREVWDSNTQKTIVNPAWEYLQAGQIVLLEQYRGSEQIYSEYFVVQSPQKADGSQNIIKTVECIPYHQRLFNKTILNGYNDTRKLFDFKYTMSDDGEITILKDSNGYPIPVEYEANKRNEGGVLNYVLENCLKGNFKDVSLNNEWKVVYFDEGLFNEIDTEFTPNAINTILFGRGCFVTGDEDLYTITYGEPIYINDNEQETATVGDTFKLKYGIAPHWYSNNTDVSPIWKNWSDTIADFDSYKYLSNSVKVSYDNYRNEIQALMETVGNYCYQSVATSEKWLYTNLRKDAYLGNELIDIVEQIMTDLKAIMSIFMSITNIENDNDAVMYEQATLDFYNEVFLKMYNPLLVFKKATGRIKYRQLEITENLTNAFDKFADSYECVFLFDNVKREISIFARNNAYINHKKNIVLSDRNWLLNFQENRDVEQVVTRLRIKGKDDLTVASVSPNGLPYIDNFTGFMSREFMSPALINALTKYNELTADYLNTTTNLIYTIYDSDTPQGWERTIVGVTFGELCDMRTTALEEYNKYKVFWDEYTAVQDEIDVLRYKESEDYYAISMSAYQDHIASIMTSAGLVEYRQSGYVYNEADLEYAYKTAESKYESINSTIARLQRAFTYENIVDENQNAVFNESLLSELNEFIYEDIYEISSLTDAMSLYKYGVQYIEYLYQVPITITANLIDIFQRNSLSDYWKRFNAIGDYAVIDYPDMGYNYVDFRVLEINHSVDTSSSTLTVTLGNKEELINSLQSITQNVWSYTYKKTQEIENYTKSWKEYSTKMQELLREGEDIELSSNPIKKSTGTVVINSAGVVPSKQSGNKIYALDDGLYCKGDGSSGEEVKPEDVITSIATLAGFELLDAVETNLLPYLCHTDWRYDTATKKFINNGTGNIIPLNTVVEYRPYTTISDYLYNAHYSRYTAAQVYTTTNTEDLIIDGKQVYFVTITGQENPYTLMTYTNPATIYNTSSGATSETFKVKVVKEVTDIIRAQLRFTRFNTDARPTLSLLSENTTFDISHDTNGDYQTDLIKSDGNVKNGFSIFRDGINLNQMYTNDYQSAMRPVVVVDTTSDTEVDNAPIGSIILVRT